MSAFDKFVDHLHKTHKPIGGRTSGTPRTPNIWWSYASCAGIANRVSINVIPAHNVFWAFRDADNCINKMIQLAIDEFDTNRSIGIIVPIFSRVFHQPTMTYEGMVRDFDRIRTSIDVYPEYYDTDGSWVDGDAIKKKADGGHTPKLEDDHGDYIWTITSMNGTKYSRRLGNKSDAENFMREYYKTASRVK